MTAGASDPSSPAGRGAGTGQDADAGAGHDADAGAGRGADADADGGGRVGGRRAQTAIIAVAGMARFMAGITMGTAMAVYVGRVGSEFAVGMVLTAYFVGMTVFAPLWGAVADVTGRRRAVLVGTGLAATAAVLPLAAVGDDAVWLPIGLRALYAVFAVGFQPVVLAVVSDLGGEEGRGRSLGLFNSARGAGFAGGQVLAGVALGALLPSGVYLLVAGLSLVSTLVAAAVVDSDPGDEAAGAASAGEAADGTAADAAGRTAADAAGGTGAATGPGTGGTTAPTAATRPGRRGAARAVLAEVRGRLLPAVGDREHLRTNGLWWLYVALALRNVTVLGAMSLMPVYLTRDVLVSELTVAGATLAPAAVMGGLLAVNPTGQSAFMYLFGRVADDLGRVPLVVAGMAGSGAFAVVAAAATVPAGLYPRVAVAAAAMVVIAASFSAMTTGALAFIGDVAPEGRESELMGLRSTAKGVGGVLGPPLLGGVATVAGIEAALAGGATLAFLAAATAAAGLVESRPDAGTAAPAPAGPGDD